MTMTMTMTRDLTFAGRFSKYVNDSVRRISFRDIFLGLGSVARRF